MADRFQHARMEELDKETDEFVWNVVCYLDSPTDYREHLPHSRQPISVPKGELVMLDEVPRYVRTWLWSITLFAIVVCVILLVVLRS